MICRLCSDNCEDEDAIPLFKNGKKCDSLIKHIMKFLNVGIKQNDLLSKHVCENCARILEDFNMFYQLVDETQKMSKRQLLLANASKQNDDPLTIEARLDEMFDMEAEMQHTMNATDECNAEYFSLKCKKCNDESLSFEKLLNHLIAQHGIDKKNNILWGAQFFDFVAEDLSMITANFQTELDITNNEPATKSYKSCQSTQINDLKRDMLTHFAKLEKDLQQQKRQLERMEHFVLNSDRQLRAGETLSDPFEETCDDTFDFESFQRLNDADELLAFNTTLGDETYMMNLIRYFEKQFVLNGKRDANVIFKSVIRKIVAPLALANYSWKGAKRTNDPLMPAQQNRSFMTDCPNIVKFFDLLLRRANSEHTRENLDQYFDKYLRNKKKEIEREADRNERNLLPRTVSARNRKRKQQYNVYDMYCEEGTSDIKIE